MVGRSIVGAKECLAGGTARRRGGIGATADSGGLSAVAAKGIDEWAISEEPGGIADSGERRRRAAGGTGEGRTEYLPRLTCRSEVAIVETDSGADRHEKAPGYEAA